MLKTNSELLEQEDKHLAPYAIKNNNCKGRKYPETQHSFRTDFQRDRDRIIHSRPFRRLEYKTQVFLNGTGDHYRTRLTHTIEVAAITRTIARALKLNEDLAESIALAHDLGHPPFGHIGEKKLNSLLKPYNLSFEHNKHSVKLVDDLIEKYPDFNGLNLTWETRSGLIKHRTETQKLDNKVLPESPFLESQVADIADDLTYFGHDLDDGLDSSLITIDSLEDLKIWQEIKEKVHKNGIYEDSNRFRPFSIRCLVDNMVIDVIQYSDKLIKEYDINSPDTPQNLKERLISFSPEMKEKTDNLKKLLFDKLYLNKEVAQINKDAAEKIENLFNFYCNNPQYLGEIASKRIETEGLYSAVSDYIAGMTDRFVMEDYNKKLLGS